MSNPKRTPVIAVLLALAAGWTSVADESEQNAQARKLSAVRDYLATTTPAADWSVYGPSSERAAAIEGISVDTTADTATISFGTTQTPAFRVVPAEDLRAVRIDFANAIAFADYQKLIMDSNGLVETSSLSLRSADPMLETVAEISFTRPMQFVSAEPSAAGLNMTFAATSEGLHLDEALLQEQAMLRELVAEVTARYSSALLSGADSCRDALGALRAQKHSLELEALQAKLTNLDGNESSNHDAAQTELQRIEGQITLYETAVSTALAAHQNTMDMATSEMRIDADSSLLMSSDSREQFRLLRAYFTKLSDTVAASAINTSKRFENLAASLDATLLAAAGKAAAEGDTLALLDSEFADIRSEQEPAQAELGALEVAMLEAIPATALDSEPEVMAAVKAPTAKPRMSFAPPTKRVEKASTQLQHPTDTTGFGKITVQHNGGEPMRLAQNADDISFTASPKATYNLYRRGVPASEDPLQQPVSIDFRDMDLSNVVSLLAEKAEINVIAGAEVRGTVTANLQDIPLGRAIETILRMNGLGIIEEAGVYRITTYDEALDARRETRIVFLQNTPAEEIEETIRQASRSVAGGTRFTVSANEDTNTLLLSGPSDAVEQMAQIVEKMDVTPQAIPTVTQVYKLNYALPNEIETIVDRILTDEGEVDADERSRQLVVTDLPGKVREITELVEILDIPVKQVAIEATIVDAVMDDNAQTGIDWFIERLPEGRLTSPNSLDTGLGGLSARTLLEPAATGSSLGLSILTGDYDIDMVISGEVTNNNAEILANPVVVTIENEPASITIAEEFPFREVSQTEAGGTLTSTEFKDIGTVLEVTPRITFENEIIAALSVKQSSVSGLSPDGVPIEDEREVVTTLRIDDGQTVLIGGLRKFNDSVSARKVPVLGDIPVLGFFFGNRNVVQDHVELLVFINCNVVEPNLPELTPYQQRKYDEVGARELKPNASKTLVDSYVNSDDYRDPFYKWRRDK